MPKRLPRRSIGRHRPTPPPTGIARIIPEAHARRQVVGNGYTTPRKSTATAFRLSGRPSRP